MTDEPSRHKVVVVSIENVVSPLLPLETVEELGALQNLGPVSSGAPRHARCAAIHVVRGRDLKVAALDVSGAQPVENARLEIGVPLAADSLACSHTTDLRILKGRQNPGQQCLWPFDVIVCHDGDGCPDMRECSTHLHPLVCNVCEKDLNSWVVQRVCELFQGLVFGGGSDEDELVGLAGQNALQRGAKLLHAVVDGGDDDSHILGSERWLLRDGLRLVAPMADAVDE